MDDDNTKPTLDVLPSEILLAVFPHVPYNAHFPPALPATCRRFHDLAQHHEHSIVKEILNHQFPWARRQFPGLLGPGAVDPAGWKELSEMYSRVAILSNIKSRCRGVKRNADGVQCAWSTARAVGLHAAGLLVLYRISDGTSLLFGAPFPLHSFSPIHPQRLTISQHQSPSSEN